MPSCLYINLLDAGSRRAALEAAFAAVPHEGWELKRVEATRPTPETSRSAAPLAVQGCFLSHTAALASALGDAEPVLIVEDDAVFARHTSAVLDQLLAAPSNWDVLMLEAGPAEFGFLTHLAWRRDSLVDQQRFEIQDLSGRPYVGAAAYLVNGASKAKLLQHLQAADLSRAYDLFLRDLCNRGELKVSLLFPFLTSFGPEADTSQIEPNDEREVWDRTLTLFRRLMFVDRDLSRLRQDAERLLTGADDQAFVLGAVLARLLSADFPRSR